MLEREVRFKIDENIKSKIIESSTLIEDVSTCVDLCMGRYGFDSLDKLGYIIRLRDKNEKCVLESKKRLNNNLWQEEKIVLNTMKEGYKFLKNIGLEPYLYINRTRQVRAINEAKIFIDEVDLLGTFVEFELIEGFDFKDIEYYLKENNIENHPEKLYGDIFKEKLSNDEFKQEFDNGLNNFLNNK